MRAKVLYSPAARITREWTLELPEGATVRQALDASGLADEFPALDLATLDLGVWGRTADNAQVLRDQDRVEVYRPLQVDPKVARRERFRSQGVRAAGLFAKKNAGTRAGG